ncbi:hypothetical protein Phi18:2_gp60 [Cellulophaga phage phi18:2]|uniref:Uncharacterized protein n=2 Tax=Cellulophaga phage phi18:1 TaxID=1327982 RepID=S0A4N6_9CAUD|nr:hypothetical protein Phi18:1_gp62 [Cellulophaga phage phi18:1]AGO48509.1 hypothetical protein Phi18:1_gp62 [Cellulophaga phage phi18:1]AGO49223.1 hypothetical protein Phi18:2_gp60 [Cellulophaga phage phi18:2]
MAVPNTNTFLLSDVRSELSLPSTTSLVACFSAAVSSRFDPAYSGSKDGLLNFRNYGATVINTFEIYNTTSYSMASNACSMAGPFNQFLFHSGSASVPSAGDILYTDSGMTSIFVGNSNYYKISVSSVNYAIRISPTGEVMEAATLC